MDQLITLRTLPVSALMQKDFNAFLLLKQNWAAYKKTHGIA